MILLDTEFHGKKSKCWISGSPPVWLDTELDWDLQSDTCSLMCNSSMPCYANKICESGVPLWIDHRTLHMRSWQEWSWEAEFHWDSSKFWTFHSSPWLWSMILLNTEFHGKKSKFWISGSPPVWLDTELDWDLQSDTCSLMCNSSMPCYANKICESGVPLWIDHRTLHMRSWQEWSWEAEFHWDSSKFGELFYDSSGCGVPLWFAPAGLSFDMRSLCLIMSCGAGVPLQTCQKHVF